MSKIFVRRAIHQGSKHIQFGINNQDCCIQEIFIVPAFGKQYQVGIISDGCTGIPGFSHTEVGAALLCLYSFGRIQEMICSGASLPEIPRALFLACTEFIRDLAYKVMPPTILWRYPVKIKDREDWDSTTRFRADCLSATLLGFITDGEDLIVFSAGDGIILVDNELDLIDQKEYPDYLANLLQAGMVMSTDNLSEFWNSFWTLHGDVGDFGPIQSVLKGLELYYIAEYQGVPKQIISRPPNDGLKIRPGGDAEALGAEYDVIDLVLISLIQNGFNPDGSVAQLNNLPQVPGFSLEVARERAEMVLKNAWKRRVPVNLTREQLGLPPISKIEL